MLNCKKGLYYLSWSLFCLQTS